MEVWNSGTYIGFCSAQQTLVGRSLVKMNGPILIRLLNLTSYPRRVYKNTLAALCEPVDSNQVDGEPWFRNAQKAETEVRVARHCQPKECVYQEQGQQRSLPAELEELLHRSTDGLNDEQIRVLTDLLNEYQDVFVISTNLFRPHQHNPAQDYHRGVQTYQASTEATSPTIEREMVLVLVFSRSPGEEERWNDTLLHRLPKGERGVTVKNSFSLPRIEDCLDALSGSQWFCTLQVVIGR